MKRFRYTEEQKERRQGELWRRHCEYVFEDLSERRPKSVEPESWEKARFHLSQSPDGEWRGVLESRAKPLVLNEREAWVLKRIADRYPKPITSKEIANADDGGPLLGDARRVREVVERLRERFTGTEWEGLIGSERGSGARRGYWVTRPVAE